MKFEEIGGGVKEVKGVKTSAFLAQAFSSFNLSSTRLRPSLCRPCRCHRLLTACCGSIYGRRGRLFRWSALPRVSVALAVRIRHFLVLVFLQIVENHTVLVNLVRVTGCYGGYRGCPTQASSSALNDDAKVRHFFGPTIR